ncbi:MAG: enoyl-CoA hydratase/isomerase family protein [Anderseniella sp.]|nr:enoyl-CoA hydratase/isomerase family protein [Anderseniella sp.]
MTEEPEIIFAIEGRAGIVTLNRPKALNALTLEMFRALHSQLQEWASDDRVERIIIEGAGDRAFCAGGDIRRLYEWGLAMDSRFLDLFREEYVLNNYIKQYPKPYIALLDGIFMGGGVGVSVHGSHRIVTERATFAMPETGIGLFPDVGSTYFLPRCPGETGMYIGLTGARLKAGDALYAGVGTHYVPHDKLHDLKQALKTFADVDEAIQHYAGHAEPETLSMHRGAIDRHFLQGSAEGVLDSLKSDPSAWAQKQASIMETKSPTSLKICHRQLRDGLTLDFRSCMKLEYRIVNRIFTGHDFFEGTRAVVIDKDNAPQWKPSSLKQVSQAEVDQYFEPLAEELPV